jgi:hypothetical protein
VVRSHKMVSCWAILFVFGLAPWAGDFKFPGSGSCFVTLVKVARDMTQEAATTKHPLQCRVSFVFDRLAFSIPCFFKRPLMNYDHNYCCLLMRCALYGLGIQV